MSELTRLETSLPEECPATLGHILVHLNEAINDEKLGDEDQLLHNVVLCYSLLRVYILTKEENQP